MNRDVLLLDFCGVLYDCDRLGQHWQGAVGEFLAPRLGGDPKAWGEANVISARRSFERMEVAARLGQPPTPDFVRREHVRWLDDMCKTVGLETRLMSDSAEPLALTVARHVTASIPESTIDRVAIALEALRARGFMAHMAAGPWSADLDDYLSAMNVRDLVGRTYGPDLIGAWKHWNQPDFYTAILADLGVPASRAIVIDDHVRHLDAAREIGCDTILIAAADRDAKRHRIARSLAEAADRLLLLDS